MEGHSSTAATGRSWKRFVIAASGALLLVAAGAASFLAVSGSPKFIPEDASLADLFGPHAPHTRRRGNKFRGIEVPDNQKVQNSFIIKLVDGVTDSQIQALCTSQATVRGQNQCGALFRKAMNAAQINLTPARLAALMDQARSPSAAHAHASTCGRTRWHRKLRSHTPCFCSMIASSISSK